MKRLLASLLIIAITSIASAQDWMTNYDEAVKTAKSENKQLLIDFTGSDWCPPCMMLSREVFERPEFKEYAAKNLVLLKIDFPRKKMLPPHVAYQNLQLQEKFNVAVFPTILVFNPDGKLAGDLGYVRGGPTAFIAALLKYAPKE